MRRTIVITLGALALVLAGATPVLADPLPPLDWPKCAGQLATKWTPDGSEAGWILFYGTVDADVIVGTANADALAGYEGGDALCGRGGADALYGDNGGAPGLDGADRLYGGGGDDDLVGYGGADLLAGGAGADQIDAREHTEDGHPPGKDTVKSGRGNDEILAGDLHKDVIDCGPGADTVEFDKGLDVLIDCETKVPA